MSVNPRSLYVAAVAALALSFGCLSGTLALFHFAADNGQVVAAGIRLA